jgi:predicted aspartyl protease
LDFVVDSGASDVSIPADVVMTLMRTGTLKDSDFLGEKTYVLADGSKVPSQTFRIRSLKVGDKVLQNVNGSIAPVQGSLLLGQSFLSRFKSWLVDNGKHALLLSECACSPEYRCIEWAPSVSVNKSAGPEKPSELGADAF